MQCLLSNVDFVWYFRKCYEADKASVSPLLERMCICRISPARYHRSLPYRASFKKMRKKSMHMH
jgi:hypothetical protein